MIFHTLVLTASIYWRRFDYENTNAPLCVYISAGEFMNVKPKANILIVTKFIEISTKPKNNLREIGQLGRTAFLITQLVILLC
jgi:hypothetical protein